MPTVEKLIEKMKRQPNGIRPEEADKVLKAYGYLPARQRGSHLHYLNLSTGDLITINADGRFPRPAGPRSPARQGHIIRPA